MNCEQALELICQALDEPLSAQQNTALQAHLDRCETCREVWQQLPMLDTALQADVSEPPPQLREQVMREVRRQADTKKHRVFLRIAAIAAAVALVVLAGSTGLLALPGFSKQASVSANVGDAAERLWQTDAAQTEAQRLADQLGLRVLVFSDCAQLPELQTLSYETQPSGSRLYSVCAELAQTLTDTYQDAYSLYIAEPQELEQTQQVCVLLRP